MDYTFIVIAVLVLALVGVVVGMIVKSSASATPVPPTPPTPPTPVVLEDGFYVNDAHFNFKKYAASEQYIIENTAVPKTLIGLSYINLDSSNHLSYIVLDNVKYYITSNTGIASDVILNYVTGIEKGQIFNFSSPTPVTPYVGDDVKYDGDGMYLLSIYKNDDGSKSVLAFKITGFNVAGNIFTEIFDPSANPLIQDTENPYIYSGTLNVIDPTSETPQYKVQANGKWNAGGVPNITSLCTAVGLVNLYTTPSLCISGNIQYTGTYGSATFTLNLTDLNAEVLTVS